MRLRSFSILATSTLLALLGCPLDEMSASSDADGAGAEASRISDNTERHDDRIDSRADVTWAGSEVGAGRSALRVLMTDAPLDADNVFVTICGIHVNALGAASPGASLPDPRDPRAPSVDGAGGAPNAPTSRDEGYGAAGRAGESAGGEPTPAPDAKDAAASAAAGGAGGELPTDDGSSDAEPNPDASDEDLNDGIDRDHERPSDERPSDDGPGPAEGPRPESDPARDGETSDNWLPVSEQCQTLDLLTLRDGVTEAVGVAALPPGRYGQIRLLIADASVVIDGVEQALVIPSGSESGVKINGGFALVDGEATTLTLDFDAGRSVHYEPGRGYMMRPVIELIDVADHAAAPADGRGGADPGVSGAGGRGGAGTDGAGARPGEPRPGPMPEDPRSAEPRPEDEPMPPEDGAAGAGAGGAGAGGAGGEGGAGDGALPSEKDEAEPDAAE